MPKTDDYEREVLAAFEKGKLKSVATKAELTKFTAAARATVIEDMAEPPATKGSGRPAAKRRTGSGH